MYTYAIYDTYSRYLDWRFSSRVDTAISSNRKPR